MVRMQYAYVWNLEKEKYNSPEEVSAVVTDDVFAVNDAAPLRVLEQRRKKKETRDENFSYLYSAVLCCTPMCALPRALPTIAEPVVAVIGGK